MIAILFFEQVVTRKLLLSIPIIIKLVFYPCMCPVSTFESLIFVKRPVDDACC